MAAAVMFVKLTKVLLLNRMQTLSAALMVNDLHVLGIVFCILMDQGDFCVSLSRDWS